MTLTAPLTDTQQDIQAMAAEFAQREVAPVLNVLESGDLNTLKMLWGKIQEAGLIGLAFPEEVGGAGLESLNYFLVLTEIAKHSAALATALSVHVSLIGMPLLTKGTPDQQSRYLEKVVSGEMIGAFALTEANAGSDAGAGICRATKDGDDYILNGTKLFITNALLADVFMVTARTHPDIPGPKGLTAFLVDRNTPNGSEGFTIHKGEEKMGLKGGDWGELEFTDCRIPAANRFGEEGHGFKAFMESLNIGRIGIGAVSLGLAEACLAASLKYVAERQQFGQSLNHFQATQFKVADMATDIEAARHLVHHAARLKDAGKPYAKEASMAKLYASELANRAANQAVQLHGGYGYTTDFPVERYFRDARVMSLFEGTSEIQRIIISRQLTS